MDLCPFFNFNMNRVFIFQILFFIFLNTQCIPPKENPKNPFPNTVFYQIYTRAFYDSNGDGLGDLNGITQKLDYIKDLGAGALWIMPIFRANTAHKYFATDFMMVDPEYGTNEDLKNLIKEAHKRGIKVLIDFSINHANPDNAWFIESVEKGESSEYYDYFHWVEDVEEYNPETYSKEGVFDSAYIKNYKQISASENVENKFYYARFLDAPDFNYDNQAIRDYFIEVGRYWLGEIGVDGLRLDAARHVYDIESTMVIDSTHRNFIWWKTFCDEMKMVNPDAFLLGEIWAGPKVMASYLKTGMHAVFNFPFSAAMLNSVRDGKNYDLVNQYLMLSNQYSKANDSYGDATFLINHDTKRLINELDYDKEKAKLAVSILMTFPGSPFIYYGEELGYEAEWPLLWLPMLWDEPGKEPGQTSWILGDSTIKNGILTVKYDKRKVSQFIPLSLQQKDSSSIFHFYRKLIRLRTSSVALTDGNLIKSEYNDQQILSFKREHENEFLLVIHNLSSDSKIIEMSDRDKSYTEVFYKSVGFKMDGTKMYLQPFCSVILKKG